MSGITVMIADVQTLSLAPALSLWLLIPVMVAAGVLTAMLYKAQRLMAPRGTVFFLTLIRMLLIVLLAILFLQPALRWTHTTTNAGTLWLVLDQSPSMTTVDPQATPQEHLRWAHGMGLVAADTARADELGAQTRAVMGELNGLSVTLGAGGGGADERAAVKEFGVRFGQWNKNLKALAAAVDNAGAALRSLTGTGETPTAKLQRAQSQAGDLANQLRSASTLSAARSAFQPYGLYHTLGDAFDSLQKAAEKADTAFLTASASDRAWTTANTTISNSTRQDLAYGFLTSADAPATKLLRDLTGKYHVRIASFSERTQAAGTVEPGALPDTLKSALAPAGTATDIGGALQYVAEQIPADEAASIIVLTDGRTNVGAEPTAPARNLAARGVHVYGLLVGSHEVSPDAAVEPADFPEWVYKGDAIKARAVIRLDGLNGKEALAELRRGGVVLESHQVRATSNHQTTVFDFTDTPPETEKAVEYEIRVSQMPGEVNTQNNVATFRVAIKKDKLYALFVEDRPRWEYRYLAAFLSRRQGMQVQTVLLEPATIAGVAATPPVMASPDNPHQEAQILPNTLEGWQKFDLIFLGDVSPETLTPQMQQFIAATVRDKGSTLITIAGQRSMPEKYANSPLGDILPISFNPQWTAEQLANHTRKGFSITPAPTAGMSTLALFDPDPVSNARAWTQMPVWYWHSALTDAKPAALVAWAMGGTQIGEPAAGADPFGSIAEANHHALLSSLTIGLGHSLYLASDQTWRLRQVGGVNLHDRFWGQVLNWAVGSDLPAGGKYVRFGSNQPTYDQTQPVTITARILHEDLTPYLGLGFSAVARPVRSAQSRPSSVTDGTVEARFQPMQSPGYYQATLSGLPVGDLEVALHGAEVERLLDNDPTVTLKTLLIKILPAMNAERRNMNTDPVLLDTIAQAGGGYSLDADAAATLFARLPKIEHQEISVQQLGFFTDPTAPGTSWAHWGFLGFFALLLTLEWTLRKRAGLV